MNPYELNPRTLARMKDLQAEAPKKALRGNETDEISWSESEVIQSLMPWGNNPDPLVRKKGLFLYREMLEDEQIKVCLDLRKKARLSTDWEFTPGKKGDKLAEELADFAEYNLMRMSGTFESKLYKIYSAIDYGYSITEIIYEPIESGKYAGKIGLKDLKTREPFSYDFKVDPHGNLIGLVYLGIRGWDPKKNSTPMIVPNLLVSPSNNDPGRTLYGTIDQPMPPEKFIIYTYNQEFGNFYGRSDLLCTYRWWQFKKHVGKFWAIWLERYGSPFVWAQYKRDAALQESALKTLDNFLKNLSVKAGIRLSDAIELKTLETQSSARGGTSYEQAINACNRYIAHGLLFPDLMGFSDSQKNGSYSLGKKHVDSFVWILEQMGRDTSESIVGEQLIKRLIDYNYPNVPEDCYPSFTFTAVEEDTIKIRADILTELKQWGFIVPEEEWVREFLTLPAKAEDVKLPDLEAVPGIDGKLTAQPKAGTAPKAGDGKDGTATKPIVPAKPVNDKGSKDPEQQKIEAAARDKGEQIFTRAPDKFERFMEIDKLKAGALAADKALYDEAKLALVELRDALISFVKKKNIVRDGNEAMLKNVPLQAGPLFKIFHKWMVKVFLDSKLHALEELGRAGLKVKIVKKFIGVSAPMEDWEPLPPQEALDYFGKKVTVRVEDKDGNPRMIDLTSGIDMPYLRQKAFSIAGVIRDDILNDAKQIILNGIKRGDDVATIKDLKDMFNKYIDQGVVVDDELLTAHRLNTIVRTNISEAINEGRASMMEDPDIAGFVDYWEYSAVIDDRTTSYCLCMDGRKFRIEDLARLKPPAHFNCRSISVPITKFTVDAMAADGDGVDLDVECPGRMAGFSYQKRELIAVPVPIVSEKGLVIPAAEPVKQTPAPTDEPAPGSSDYVRKQLAPLVMKCPYKSCNYPDVTFTKANFNVGEFLCGHCGMPFRVSLKGDLYLYDAGTDKWDRTSMGMFPGYFREQMWWEKLKAKADHD